MKKVAKSSKVELEAGFKAKSGAKSCSNLYILLSIREKFLNIAIKGVERVIKAQFLQR